MNNIVTTLSKISILLLAAALNSCGNNLEPKMPIFTKDFNQTMQEIGAIGNFSEVSFKLSANQTNNEKSSNELELKLFNGQNLPDNERGLDSIAKNAAKIFKSSIKNINDYDWISVIFDRNDGTTVDMPKKKVFVYRPNALE